MTDKTTLSLPREPDSVPAARAALARFEDRLSESMLYDASLCLSELVTNAIQHPDAESGDEVELELSLTDDALLVRVIDPGGDFQPGAPTEGDERGWGLFIVDQLSTRWGTQPGKRTIMWFEMVLEEAELPERSTGGQSEPSERGHQGRGEMTSAVARLRVSPVIQ